jgi:sulfite reductase beta subunit-like hemoprotein
LLTVGNHQILEPAPDEQPMWQSQLSPIDGKVALREIAEVLDPPFALFSLVRLDGEGFGDFCHRAGPAALQEALAGQHKGAA